MAELKPVPGVARLVVHGEYAGSLPTVNVFHVDRLEGSTAPWTQAELSAFTTGFRLIYKTRFCPRITSSWSLKQVEATDLTSDVGVTAAEGGSDAGAMAGFSTPYNVAQCITWKIPRHYRGGHPRTYLPCPGQTGVTGGATWEATHLAALEAAAKGFRTDILAATGGAVFPKLCVVHRYRGHTFDPTTHRKIPTQLAVPLKTYIADATVDSRVDSMRRRLGKDR